MKIIILLLLALVSLLLAALLRSGREIGKAQEQARQLKEQNHETRKAHEIQNHVAMDYDYRERVRRKFDRP